MGKAAASSPAGDLRERRFSGRLSDDYDIWRLARPFLGEVHEIVIRAVRSFTEARDRPLRALDIGMGEGAITRLLVADAQLSVTGVDNEPKMIKKARERLTADLSSGRHKRERRIAKPSAGSSTGSSTCSCPARDTISCANGCCIMSRMKLPAG